MQVLGVNEIEFLMILSLRVLCKLASKLCEFAFETKTLMHDLIISLILLYLLKSNYVKIFN